MGEDPPEEDANSRVGSHLVLVLVYILAFVPTNVPFEENQSFLGGIMQSPWVGGVANWGRPALKKIQISGV